LQPWAGIRFDRFHGFCQTRGFSFDTDVCHYALLCKAPEDMPTAHRTPIPGIGGAKSPQFSAHESRSIAHRAGSAAPL
jgi:hypothetical protein